MAGEVKGGDVKEERHNGKGNGQKKQKPADPQPPERPVTKCWVHRRKDDTMTWQRFYATLVDAELKTFKDEKEQDILERVQLAGCSVKTVTSSSREEVQNGRLNHGKPSKRHHSKAITIWARESQLQSQLPVNTPERRSRAPVEADKRVEICFAVEKADDHTPFLNRIQAAASCERRSSPDPASCDSLRAIDGDTYKASLRADTKSNGTGGWDASLFLPSEGIIARLCASGLIQSRNLLESLRATRGVFAQGRHNLGELPKEWENGRQALINLSSQLEAMQMSIARHCQDSLADDASKGALDAASEWVNRLREWVSNRQMEALNLCQSSERQVFGVGWAAFAQSTIVQLQDIEQAMHLGEIAALQLQQQKEGSIAGAPPSRRPCIAVPRPALPYNAYWRTKIAI